VLQLCGAVRQDDFYQYGDGQYDSQQNDDVPVEPIRCYTCEYAVLASQRHEEGVRACMDPFSGDGVPEILCSGPCAVSSTTSETWRFSQRAPLLKRKYRGWI